MIRIVAADASFEDIQYRHYPVEKIAAGLASPEADGGIPHDVVKAELAKRRERDFAAAIAETVAEMSRNPRRKTATARRLITPLKQSAPHTAQRARRDAGKTPARRGQDTHFARQSR